MSPLFTAIVVILALLAVMGIVVGVANDAVNFLNSALGSKAAPRRVILWIAAAGILVGTLTSSGMMEVARSGVFYPGQFSFQEIMMLFLGMMLGNILLLDVAGAFIACTTLLLVRIPNPERSTAQKPSLWREFREGFGAMHAVPGMGWFFTLAVLVWFFIMPVGVMFPLMTLQHFGGGAYDMSLIEIVWGGGALIGGAVMGAPTYRVNPFPDRRRHEQRLQLVVRLRHPEPHRRGSAGARHVAVLQFRTAPLGDRTARHGLPRRACRPDDDLRHRRHGHLLHRTRRILHPFGHAARPTIFLTTEIHYDKKKSEADKPRSFSFE